MSARPLFCVLLAVAATTSATAQSSTKYRPGRPSRPQPAARAAPVRTPAPKPTRTPGADVASASASGSTKPVEAGEVNWGRDLEAARRESAADGRPVLILFQEIPGCAGCQAFGRDVLSHPLIVEAIETEFHPVLVYNNRSGGPDAALLKRYNEPAWNYQVIRFVGADGRDLIERRDRVWTVAAVAGRIVEALRAAGRPVPKYLHSLIAINTPDIETAAFAMHCFWTGEYHLGSIDGVIATEAGWLDGREVTLVRYDPAALPLDRLASRAAGLECAHRVYTPDAKPLAGLDAGQLDDSYRPASTSDQKRQLSRWPAIKKIPGINANQLTKLNSLAPRDVTAALSHLSPRQRTWLRSRLQ